MPYSTGAGKWNASVTDLQKTVTIDTSSTIQRVKGLDNIIFPLQNKYQNLKKKNSFFAFKHVCLFTILLQNIENALTSLWMDVYMPPQIWFMSTSDKSHPCISDEMEKDAVCQAGMASRNVFIGLQRAVLSPYLSPHPGPWVGVRPLPAGFGPAELLTWGASLSEITWGSYPLGIPVRARGEAFYVSHAIASHSCFFLVLFTFPHQPGSQIY